MQSVRDSVSRYWITIVPLLYLAVIHFNFGFITQISIYCLAVLLFICPGRNYNDKTGWYILLYSISYCIIYWLKDSIDASSIALDILAPITFYFLGKYIVDNSYNENNIVKAILLFVFCSGAVIYYSTLKDIVDTGQIVDISRQFYLLGEEDRAMSATGVGLNVSMGLFGLAAFFLLKEHKILRFSSLIIFILSILSNIHLVNRTGLIIALLVTLLVIGTYYKKRKFVLISVAVCVVIYILLSYFGFVGSEIFSAYSDRALDEGASLRSGGGRTNRWINALFAIPRYPFGWDDSNIAGVYVHNMWLDVAKNAGWIPFFFLVGMTALSIKDLKVLLRNKRNKISCLIFGAYSCILIALFVEPTIGGFSFACLCLIIGVQKRYSQVA